MITQDFIDELRDIARNNSTNIPKLVEAFLRGKELADSNKKHPLLPKLRAVQKLLSTYASNERVRRKRLNIV